MALAFITTKQIAEFRKRHGMDPKAKLTEEQYQQLFTELADRQKRLAEKSTLTQRLSAASLDGKNNDRMQINQNLRESESKNSENTAVMNKMKREGR
jgi:DICT domain-containing protein